MERGLLEEEERQRMVRDHEMEVMTPTAVAVPSHVTNETVEKSFCIIWFQTFINLKGNRAFV